jgi:DNA-directed RNA polymerase I, II, and III subunit RPABC2
MADELDKILGGESDIDIDDDSSVASSGGGSIGDLIESDIEGGEGRSDSDEDEDEDEVEQDDNSDNGNEKERDAVEEEFDNGSGSDEEDEEEEDEDYLQKMEDEVRKKVIEDHHPELKTLNYEEVEALATVVRDKNNQIIDPLHRTLPILTRYEKARILGERARQLNAGATPMIDVEPSLIDGYLIALKELEQKRIPFIIQRPLPNGGSEYWRVNDLE